MIETSTAGKPGRPPNPPMPPLSATENGLLKASQLTKREHMILECLKASSGCDFGARSIDALAQTKGITYQEAAAAIAISQTDTILNQIAATTPKV